MICQIILWLYSSKGSQINQQHSTCRFFKEVALNFHTTDCATSEHHSFYFTDGRNGNFQRGSATGNGKLFNAARAPLRGALNSFSIIYSRRLHHNSFSATYLCGFHHKVCGLQYRTIFKFIFSFNIAQYRSVLLNFRWYWTNTRLFF